MLHKFAEVKLERRNGRCPLLVAVNVEHDRGENRVRRILLSFDLMYTIIMREKKKVPVLGRFKLAWAVLLKREKRIQKK